MDSGVKGSWSEDADGRCVTLKRPGSMPFSGEVSVCASAADGATMQLRAHSDLTATMRDFSRGSDLSDAPGAQQMQHVYMMSATNASTQSSTRADHTLSVLSFFTKLSTEKLMGKMTIAAKMSAMVKCPPVVYVLFAVAAATIAPTIVTM